MLRFVVLILAAIGGSLLTAGILSFSYLYLPTSNRPLLLDAEQLKDSVANALKNDEVLVRVHDRDGNLKIEQKTHNIITTAGAIWFCVQQDRCESHITSPAITSTQNPTWWVQFISGTPNANEPTGADCTAPAGGGALSGQVSGTRCVTNFGSAPAQYQSGGSIITVSNLAGAGQLRGTGTFDTTNNFVQSTRATLCSVVVDGTAPSSGTCQFTDTTVVLTNLSGSTIAVNGLALASGSNSATTAGSLIIAESAISAITLNPSDTISVSWTIVT